MALRNFMVFLSLKVTLWPPEPLKVSETRRVSTGGGGMLLGTASSMASSTAASMASVDSGMLAPAPSSWSAAWVLEAGELFPEAIFVCACVG